MLLVQNILPSFFKDGSRRMSSVVTNGSRKHLTSYYESLRSNVMSILGHVKVPSEEMHAGAVAAAGVCSAGAAVSSGPSKDNFDSYLTKLQSICTETMTNDEIKPITSSTSVGGGLVGGHQIKP